MDAVQQATDMMNNIIVQRIIDITNEAIAADPSAMRAMFENRIPCNQRLSDHDSIQVMKESEAVGNTVGVFGLLSGIAGTMQYKDNPHYSRIWAVYNVVCPVHGVKEDDEDVHLVGDNCPRSDESCNEKMILGDLLRVERVPTSNE